MYSINNDYIYEEIIKKSKFITYLYKVSTVEEIKEKLEKIRNEHKSATHVCYAYRINEIEKCSDDGEPSGTAGIPILNILQKQNINFILCIVVRYFGGIKLGAGGLIRAYSGSCKNALKNIKIVLVNEYYEIDLIFDYEKLKIIENLLKDVQIISKKYDVNIIYRIIIDKNYFTKINNSLIINCNNIVIVNNFKN